MFLAALLAAGCGGGGESGSPPRTVDPYVYEVPPQRNDGWLVSGLETEGIDQQRLVDMMEFIYDRRDDEFLRNVLVVRNNRLVFEEYFGTTHVDSLSHLQSATKSIVSAIYGVALSNGHAGAPDDTLFMYFPEYQHLSTPDKENIRIRDVLSMSPGFDWNEGSVPTLAAENDNLAAYRSGNSIRYVLEKEVVAPPGSVWNYNSGCPMLLAGVVRNQSGMHLDEYGDLYLFGPLGITAGRWEYQSDGLPLATGGLWIRARDAAKFGQLYLDGGVWNGQQVVPADWVAESLTHHASPQNGVGYGYQWWTEQPALLRIWYAAGYGGQRIVIVPERDAAVVINADYARDANEDGRRAGRGQSLLTSFILPALQRPAPGASSRRSGARP